MFIHQLRQMKAVKAALAILLVTALFFGSVFSAPAAQASNSTNVKLFVMLNLSDVTDFTAFDKQMATLKSNGVYGVEVDMWWDHFEPQKGQYQWGYYQKLFTHIQNAGLKIAPIFSFHECGGNVGDTCNYPLPSWVWNEGTQDELKFKSESGYYHTEYIAPWFKPATVWYDGAFKSFAANMSQFASSIEKIHIGLGPAGELRYPSYSFRDSWSYPSRGKFQAYSTAAVADFQSIMQQKYITIGQLNSAWGTSFSSFTEVQPPANGDQFYANGDYSKPYGIDFLTWYQGVLTRHMTDVVGKAHQSLDAAFGKHLSVKVPGIHWQYSNPAAPHSAEHAAGLYDYGTLIDAFKTSNVDLVFTCLEMTNQANGNGESPNYSRPQDLVAHVAALANQKGVLIEGENALPVWDAKTYTDVIHNVLMTHQFDAFTLLRLENVVTASGKATSQLVPFVAGVTTGVIPPKPSQAVTFNVYDPSGYSVTNSVYIVGNNSAIGDWNPSNAVPGTYVGNGYWQVNTTLLATQTYNFKAIKKDLSGNVTWENGSDHAWTVPYVAGGTALYKSTWTGNQFNNSLKHYITGEVQLSGSDSAGTIVSLTDANDNVLSAVYGENKQSTHGIYGLSGVNHDSSKVRYYFEVPAGTYTVDVTNGNAIRSITVDANSQSTADIAGGTYLLDEVPALVLPAPVAKGYHIFGDIDLNGNAAAETKIEVKKDGLTVAAATYGNGEGTTSYGKVNIVQKYAPEHANFGKILHFYADVAPTAGIYTLVIKNGLQEKTYDITASSTQAVLISNNYYYLADAGSKQLDAPVKKISDPDPAVIPSNPGAAPAPEVSAAAAGMNKDKEVVGAPTTSVIEKDPNGVSIKVTTIDSAALLKEIQKNTSVKAVIVPVSSEQGRAKVTISPEVLAKAAENNAKSMLVLQAEGASYNLPVSLIDQKVLAATLGGKESETADAKVDVLITEKPAASVSKGKVASKVIDFSIVVSNASGSKELRDFNGTYVDRAFDISGSIDNKKAVGVVVKEDGSVAPVPTQFVDVNGKKIAVLKRNTNSTYTVIENDITEFADLNGHWSKQDVMDMTRKLIVNGKQVDAFAPEDKVTRAEFASLLIRALGLEGEKTSKFTDVQANDWFAEAVTAAGKAGLIEGFEDGTFRPNSEITREQMAVMMMRAYEFTGNKASLESSSSSYADSHEINGYAKQFVDKATSLGLMNGLELNRFAPQDSAKRSEAAVLLKRFMNAVGFMN